MADLRERLAEVSAAFSERQQGLTSTDYLVSCSYQHGAPDQDVTIVSSVLHHMGFGWVQTCCSGMQK